MILRELFNTEAKWKWTAVQPALMNAEIYLNGHTYEVAFYSFDQTIKAWIVEFTDSYARDPFAMTNRGDALAILSTVVTIIKEAIQKSGANVVMFEAKEPSRQKVYSHLVSRLSSDARAVDRNGSKRYLVPTSPEGVAIVDKMVGRAGVEPAT